MMEAEPAGMVAASVRGKSRCVNFLKSMVVSLFQRSAAVSKTSRNSFNALRLTLRAQPRSENCKLGHHQKHLKSGDERQFLFPPRR
jgi:hypothetical protein